jgi:hypothetical protein
MIPQLAPISVLDFANIALEAGGSFLCEPQNDLTDHRMSVGAATRRSEYQDRPIRHEDIYSDSGASVGPSTTVRTVAASSERKPNTEYFSNRTGADNSNTHVYATSCLREGREEAQNEI